VARGADGGAADQDSTPAVAAPWLAVEEGLIPAIAPLAAAWDKAAGGQPSQPLAAANPTGRARHGQSVRLLTPAHVRTAREGAEDAEPPSEGSLPLAWTYNMAFPALALGMAGLYQQHRTRKERRAGREVVHM
jgi:hypothetical protein